MGHPHLHHGTPDDVGKDDENDEDEEDDSSDDE